MGKIEQWYIVHLNKSYVMGTVWGSSSLFDGSMAQVEIVDLNPVTKVLTSPTELLKLGQPDAEWWKMQQHHMKLTSK